MPLPLVLMECCVFLSLSLSLHMRVCWVKSLGEAWDGWIDGGAARGGGEGRRLAQLLYLPLGR
jgi:hypothetical protein